MSPLAVLLAACTPDPATTPDTDEAEDTDDVVDTDDTGTTPPETTGDTGTAPVPEPLLLVSSYWAGKVHLFDGDGALVGVIEGVDGAQTVVVAPNGEWVACAETKNQILRVDPVSLAVLGILVGDDPATPDTDETGGLLNPDAAIFGPDGRLYVSSFETDAILRYEADGTFVDAFVPPGTGGLDGPDIGLAFAPNGEFLVPGWYSHRIHRYDGATGAYLGDLIGPDEGLGNPRAIRFDAGGRLYVSGWATDGVLRHDFATGETVKLVERPEATGLVLDEDAGEILVASADDTVRAYAIEDGADLGERVSFRPIDGATAIDRLTR